MGLAADIYIHPDCLYRIRFDENVIGVFGWLFGGGGVFFNVFFDFFVNPDAAPWLAAH